MRQFNKLKKRLVKSKVVKKSKGFKNFKFVNPFFIPFIFLLVLALND